MNWLKDNKFMKKIKGDHSLMTKASLAVLSKQDRNFINEETVPIILYYCWFPDFNYASYGNPVRQLDPDSPFRPDERRAWGISEIMGWNPVSKTGKQNRTSYVADADNIAPEELPAWSFKNAVKSIKAGDLAKGFRFLGSAAHLLEDAGSSSISFFFHGSPVLGGQDKKPEPDISGYVPKNIGQDIPSACRNIKKLFHSIEEASRESVQKMRKAFRDVGSEKELKRLFLKFEREQQSYPCRAVADMFHTAIYLAGAKPKYTPPKTDENLVENASFEIDDGENMPRGWYIVRHNLSDRSGRAIWLGNYESSEEQTAHSGARSVLLANTPKEGLEWRLSWPYKIDVKFGQIYRCRYWINLNRATGNSCVAVYLYKGNYELKKKVTGMKESGTIAWTKREFDFVIPKEVKILLPACCSSNNKGFAAFDDLELVRLTSAKKNKKVAEEVEKIDEDAILILRFLEKEFIKDREAHGGWGYHIASGKMLQDLSLYTKHNYGIFCFSGNRWTDLHVQEKNGEWCLKFDGKDDFVEIPTRGIFGTNIDMYALNEFSVCMRVWLDEYADMVLFTKDNNTIRGRSGYQLRVDKDGKICFLAGLQGRGFEKMVEAKCPLNKWIDIWIAVFNNRMVNLYVDKELKDSAKFSNGFLCSNNALYLGSDNGLSDFFKGKIAFFAFYRRGLMYRKFV